MLDTRHAQIDVHIILIFNMIPISSEIHMQTMNTDINIPKYIVYMCLSVQQIHTCPPARSPEYFWSICIQIRIQCNIQYLLIIRLYNITVIQIQILWSIRRSATRISSSFSLPWMGFCVPNGMFLPFLPPPAPLHHAYIRSRHYYWNFPDETKCAFVFNFITKYTLIIAINNAIIPNSGNLRYHIEARTNATTQHISTTQQFCVFCDNQIRCCSPLCSTWLFISLLNFLLMQM